MSLSTYSSLSQRKAQKQKPCRVLLVCVYETIIFELTNSIIFDKFSPFGGITKILIFQKGEVTKFFIEYNQIDSALNVTAFIIFQARTSLNGAKFFENICKMNIFFSNFNNVDLKHESSEGADYENLEDDSKSQFVQSFDHLARSSQEQNIDYLDDQILMQTFSNLGVGNAKTFTRSKTENPKKLQQQIIKMSNISHMSVSPIEQQEVDKSIKLEIHSLLSDNYQNGNSSQKGNLVQHYQYKDNFNQKNFSVNINHVTNEDTNQTLARQSSVIFYHLSEWVPLRQIYNLFSNFGNIQCIVAKKHQVYIKFRSGYFAAVAMNYLSGTFLLGNHLNLSYAENMESYLPKPFQYSESIYFQQSFDRFTPKKSITVNPPSDTLHVSSIKKDSCNQNALRKIFSPCGYVDRVKILMQSNQKNMALVKFSSIKDSFAAISQLHNKQFGGRKMQISFTKSKL